MLFALARSLRSEVAPTRVKVALLASLVAALVAGIWIVQVIAIQRLLYQDAVSTGHLWASYMAENVGDLAAIAEGATPSAASVTFFERAQKVGNVFRYKVFSPEGHLRLVSDQLSVAGTDAQNLREHNLAAAGAIAAGRPMVVAKTGKPPARPPFFSEAYVPVIVGGRTIAIVEAYVDQSDKREDYYSVLSIAAISLSLLVLLAFGVPAAAYMRAREKQTASLNAALASMSQGLAVFDANQRIVIANRRYGEMYDLPPEQIKPGTPLREILAARAAKGIYDSESTKEWVERGLANFHKEASDVLHLSDGRVISVLRRPMSNGGLVSTHEDITQQDKLNARIEYQHKLIKAQQEKLKAKNLLGAALDNMGEGLCMFDADRRLLVCNDRYAKLYQLPQELLAVGTPHDAIIAHRVSNGILKGDKSGVAVTQKLSALGQLPAERSSSRIDELADGRLICVTREPMVGGGWVATHEDISARVLAERRLEETKKFLDTVIESLPVPVIVKEPNALQFVLVNQAYEKFVGVSRENLLGKSVHEIFGPESADMISKCDRDALNADENLIATDFPVRTPANRDRIVTATKLVVRNDANQPQHLITVLEDITERRESEKKILHMAQHDALTGLPNRALLNERLDHALTRTKRGEIVAAHILDLDHFKHVNDTLGHPVGDRLLQMVAERLQALVRDTDTIARMGGDEFAIVQVALSQVTDATVLAQRIIAAIGEPYNIEGHQVVTGTSVGIAVAPADGTSPDQLVKNADLALYRAKGHGRGTLRFFEPDMDEQMQARRALEHDLRKALTAGQFELHYQPVINLDSDKISGCEALIRWRHPDRGLVSPMTFIPMAEETGLIVPIGEWVIRQACATAAKWPSDLKIAVNLSPAQLRSAGLMQVVVSALATSGLAPDRLELEITETVLLHDSETTLATLFELRELGVHIAMDDFGTGYSSLSYLQSFPFDRIKIDRSFIADVTEGVGSRNIVRAVVALANGLGMQTTAEGVETQEQLDAIRSEGCAEMQGFLYSKPLPAHEVEQLFFSKQIERKTPAAA